MNQLKRYFIDPEVAGGFGANTIFGSSKHILSDTLNIPSIKFLDYRFDDWMGDCIIGFLSVYAITEEFSVLITQKKMSGFVIESMECSESDMWDQIRGDCSVPEMKRIIPLNEIMLDKNLNATKDISEFDVYFGICLEWKESKAGISYGLIISERFLNCAKNLGLNNCDIFEIN